MAKRDSSAGYWLKGNNLRLICLRWAVLLPGQHRNQFCICAVDITAVERIIGTGSRGKSDRFRTAGKAKNFATRALCGLGYGVTVMAAE